MVIRIPYKAGKSELSGKTCYVGVDVHKLTYYTSILSDDGAYVQFAGPANPRTLISQIRGMGVEIAALVHETGPTGYELAWHCQEVGVPVIVAAASKIPRQVARDSKTDRLDSLKLAEYLSKDMLRGIAIPSRSEYALREIERRRQQLLRSRRKLRLQIKSFLLKSGITAPAGLEHWSQKGLIELRGMRLKDPYLRTALKSYLREHAFICDELGKAANDLENALHKEGKKELLENLQTIPGVGVTVSRTFVAEIFRPERFNRAEEICAYVGLAPITSQSGQGKAKARLGQTGQDYLRSILIESAWFLVRKDAWYRSLYNRIIGRTKLPQKAIVAVARKLLVILWRLSIENRVYQYRDIEA